VPLAWCRGLRRRTVSVARDPQALKQAVEFAAHPLVLGFQVGDPLLQDGPGWRAHAALRSGTSWNFVRTTSQLNTCASSSRVM